MPPEKNVITSNIVIMTRRLYNNLQFVDTTVQFEACKAII